MGHSLSPPSHFTLATGLNRELSLVPFGSTNESDKILLNEKARSLT